MNTTTKNQRIAAAIARMSLNFSNISRDMMEINAVLLEKDTVPATTSFPAKPAWVKNVSDLGPDAAKKILGDSWKDDTTRRIVSLAVRQTELNELAKGNTPKVATVTTQPVTQNTGNSYVGKFIRDISLNLTLQCIRINKINIYYKIKEGPDKGAVLQVHKGKVDVDGRYTNKFNYGSTHIAIVSCDQDGRDYVNRVIRGKLNVNGRKVKLVRMYRPKGFAGHFTHCDVYLRIQK